MSKPKAPEGETPQQKFERVAGVRVSNIVSALDMLAGMGADVPSDAHRDGAFTAIQVAFDRALGAWNAKKPAAKKRLFTFGADPKQEQLPHTQPQQQKAAPQATNRR